MNCANCQFVERRGSVLCCQIKQLPIYMIQECKSYKEYKDEEYYRILGEVKK